MKKEDFIVYNLEKRKKIFVQKTEECDKITLGNDVERDLLLLNLVHYLSKNNYYLDTKIIDFITKEELKELFSAVNIDKSEDMLNFDYLDIIKINSNIMSNYPDNIIKIMTYCEFINIPTELLKTNSAPSLYRKAELMWFLENYSDKIEIPKYIPFKENLCIVLNMIRDYDGIIKINDTLRLGLYFLGIKPSLISQKILNSNRHQLNRLPRKDREYICSVINRVVSTTNMDNLISDAKKYYSKWHLLLSRLHPGDFKNKYVFCNNFSYFLRNNKNRRSVPTWESTIQKMYDNKEPIIDIANEISKRPGEFIRRFDSLLVKSIENNKEGELMDIFIDNLKSIKIELLFDLFNFYQKRNNYTETRYVYSALRGRYYKISPLKHISDNMISVIKSFIIRGIYSSISSKIEEKDLIGKTVYLDPLIKEIPIPTDMRDSDIEVSSGTRIKIPEGKKIIRFFLNWVQDESRNEDLDLHSFLYKSDDEVTNVGWNTGLSETNECCSHSGDVRNKIGECTEYVDIDIDKCIETGIKYATVDICNFYKRPLNSLPCSIGYCYPPDQTSILLFNKYKWSHTKDTDKIEETIKITSDSISLSAFILDLSNRNIVITNCKLSKRFNDVDTLAVQEQKNIIDRFINNDGLLNSYTILEQYYLSRGATIVNEDMQINRETDEKIQLHEKVTKDMILNDYSIVLNILH